MRKPKTKSEPNLRDRLSQNFLRAFESDFEANGTAIIEALRLKSPEKYAEIASRLIAAAEPPRALSDYSECKTQEDVDRQLLMQMGAAENLITQDMVERAIRANEKLVDSLATIIADGGLGQYGNWHDDVDEGSRRN